jgi:hypothetical protein
VKPAPLQSIEYVLTSPMVAIAFTLGPHGTVGNGCDDFENEKIE